MRLVAARAPTCRAPIWPGVDGIATVRLNVNRISIAPPIGIVMPTAWSTSVTATRSAVQVKSSTTIVSAKRFGSRTTCMPAMKRANHDRGSRAWT